MGCCYSKANRKIDATDTETEGIINKSDEFIFKVTGKKNLKLNFRINIEVNQEEDSEIKSSKPETSEDSLNKNKISYKDCSKADNMNQTMDDDYNYPSFFIENFHKKGNLHYINSDKNLLQSEDEKQDELKRENKIEYEYKENILENNTSSFLLSPKNLNFRTKTFEELQYYINPDPQHPNFSNYSDLSSSQKKRRSLGFQALNNSRDDSHNKSDDSLMNNYNSNFSLSQNTAVNQALSQNFGSFSNNNFAIYNINEFNTEKLEKYFPNLLPKKNFVFLYFEILNFNFCLKDYFKGIYPETNLVMILEINDCILSQEKIFFVKSDENIYQPILKKEDLQYQDDKRINRYRIIKPVEINDENYPIKISFTFCSFTNMRLLSIGSEDFFFKMIPEDNLNKFHLYQNIHLKYVSKKIGNLSFNYAYKVDEIYSQELLLEMKKNLRIFTNLEKMKLFKDDNSLIFNYYNITDENYCSGENKSLIKAIGSPSCPLLNSPNDQEKNNARYSYFTIDEIEKIDITQELENADLKSDRLLELVDFNHSNQEFYSLFKKIDCIIFKTELNLEKLNLFKEKIHKKLEEYLNSRFQSDVFIIPLMFSVMRKCFYRGRKEGELRRTNNVENSKNGNLHSPNNEKKIKSSHSVQKTKDNLNNDKIHHTKNGHLLLESFKIVFGFIVKDYSEDILLSALNYIYRFFEDPISYEIDGKHFTTDNFLVECIVKNKLYITLCNLIVKYPEYQACVQPSLDIILRIIKVKKNEIQELIDIISSEKFLNVLKMIMLIHECNMKIINELFLVFFQIGEKSDLKNFTYLFCFNRMREIFNIFKMNGFDYIHEIILRLVRHICSRKLNSNISQNFSANSQKKILRDKKNNSSFDDNNINNTNNKTNISTEENEQMDLTYILSTDEFVEVNLIFSNALQFIKNKISLFYDVLKNPKQIVNLVTNINIMLDTLCLAVSKKPKRIGIIQNLKILDNFINIIMLINETRFIYEMERFFSRNDPNLINNKVLIIKMLNNLSKLSKIMKESIPNSMENNTFKKFQEFVKKILKDNYYSPIYINFIIEENCSNSNKFDKDENIKRNIKNLDIMYSDIGSFYS